MNFLDLIFPPVCGLCGKLASTHICVECADKMSRKLEYRIRKVEDKNFSTQIYILNYEGNIRNRILSYKFKNKSYLYNTFTKIILNNKKICNILKTYDIIMPVPIHKKRKNERGYNQSELIAKGLAKNLINVEFKKGLKKIKNNLKQSSLDREKRKLNVKNAYEIINKEIIKDKRIILFDDVYTTGSTADECCRMLKQSGAKEILVLTIAGVNQRNN